MSNQKNDIITMSAPEWAWEILFQTMEKKIENPKVKIEKRKKLAEALASFTETARKIERKPLTLNDLVVGKEYRFAEHPGVREYLWGKRCRVEKKNIKKVKSVLLEDTTRWKAGTILTGPPYHLEELI